MNSVQMTVVSFDEQNTALTVDMTLTTEKGTSQVYTITYTVSDYNTINITEILKRTAFNGLLVIDNDQKKIELQSDTDFINNMKSTIGNTYNYTVNEIINIDFETD